MGVLLFTPISFYFEDQQFFTVEKISPSDFSEKALYVGPVKNSYLESPNYCLVQKSELVGLASPVTVNVQTLGSLMDETLEEIPATNKEIIEYIIKPGDSIASIAKKFNISVETLLWANDLTKSSKIKPGDGLIILPVSGVLHYVKSGEKLSEIAKRYKADIEDIVSFNELSNENDIYVGDILIIPNGVMPASSPKYAITPSQVPVADSYFIPPLPVPYIVTQGLHWYNAVDLTRGKCGDPIYAAAQGVVQKAKYDSVGGNHITILHPNGVVTYYGHLQKMLVSSGQTVSQGDIIGLMGGQPGMTGAGKSTGCHIHFGVIGAKNPFAK